MIQSPRLRRDEPSRAPGASQQMGVAAELFTSRGATAARTAREPAK